MSATRSEDELTQTPLEEELHELEDKEQALEQRTRSLEITGLPTLLVSLIAVALAMAALVVALSNKDSSPANVAATPSVSAAGGAGSGASAVSSSGGASGSNMPMGSAGGKAAGTTAGMSGAMMGFGGHGSFTSAQASAAAHGTVYVQLGDYWVAPTVASVKAGKVTFIAKNVGQVPHELMVERAPIKFDAPMRPNEDAAQGMIDDMSAGQSGRMSVRLTPGTYILFCNAPGHYMLGQHIVFRVKAS